MVEDSYSEFLKRFNIKEKDFLEYGNKSIIYVPKDIVKREWENLKHRITNNEEVYIRPYGNNGKNSEIFLKFIKEVFNNSNVKLDKSRNSKPKLCLKKYIENELGKEIQNYQVSHIFGMTKNPYMFECPWNIAYIPKIFDPFTGHESNGEWTQKFQDYYLQDVQDKFQEFIEDYNNIMIENNIVDRIESFVNNLKGYNQKQKKTFKKNLLDNFKIIPLTKRGDKVKVSTYKKKIGKFVYDSMKELEKENKKIDEEQLEYLVNPQKSHEYFRTKENLPVLKEYDENNKSRSQHYVDGYQRYKSPNKLIIKLNGKKYMVTKELYEYQRERFNNWFNAQK